MFKRCFTEQQTGSYWIVCFFKFYDIADVRRLSDSADSIKCKQKTQVVPSQHGVCPWVEHVVCWRQLADQYNFWSPGGIALIYVCLPLIFLTSSAFLTSGMRFCVGWRCMAHLHQLHQLHQLSLPSTLGLLAATVSAQRFPKSLHSGVAWLCCCWLEGGFADHLFTPMLFSVVRFTFKLEAAQCWMLLE